MRTSTRKSISAVGKYRRAAGVADVDVVLRLHQDPLAVAHNPGDALADRPAAQRLLQRWSEHWVRHGVGYWAVSW
jgi:hypothetical protein